MWEKEKKKKTPMNPPLGINYCFYFGFIFNSCIINTLYSVSTQQIFNEYLLNE